MAGEVAVHLSRNEQGFGLRFQEYTDGQGHMIVKVFENTEAARCGLIQEGDRLVKVKRSPPSISPAAAHGRLQIGEEDVRLWEFQRMITFLKAQSKVKLSLKSASPAAF